MQYIDAYFQGNLSNEDKSAFEKRIVEDKDFAEEVAFYLSVMQVSAEQLNNNRERFREIYNQHKISSNLKTKQPGLLKKIWPWMTVAAVLAGIIFGWYAWFKPVDHSVLADQYITDNFQTLPVTMGNKQDSLQTALRLYNEGKPEESLSYLESLVAHDTTFTDAKKYAGIVCLHMEQYDKAISYFTQLENNTRLYSNPGKFYNALTLMKRNRPGDADKARQLLHQVVDAGLEGDQLAKRWLKKW